MSVTWMTEWLETVNQHYGTLDKFDDATMIRTMRQSAIDWLKEDRRVGDEITSAFGQKEWEETFSADRETLQTIIRQLDHWLVDRGLEP